jgi:hypothetical protein
VSSCPKGIYRPTADRAGEAPSRDGDASQRLARPAAPAHALVAPLFDSRLACPHREVRWTDVFLYFTPAPDPSPLLPIFSPSFNNNYQATILLYHGCRIVSLKQRRRGGPGVCCITKLSVVSVPYHPPPLRQLPIAIHLIANVNLKSRGVPHRFCSRELSVQYKRSSPTDLFHRPHPHPRPRTFPPTSTRTRTLLSNMAAEFSNATVAPQPTPYHHAYKKSAQYTPMHSGASSPMHVSPTSPHDASHVNHVNNAPPLRPLKTPLYVPAALRRTERGSRGSPPKGERRVDSPNSGWNINTFRQGAGDVTPTTGLATEDLNSIFNDVPFSPIAGPITRNHWQVRLICISLSFFSCLVFFPSTLARCVCRCYQLVACLPICIQLLRTCSGVGPSSVTLGRRQFQCRSLYPLNGQCLSTLSAT